MTPPDPGDWRQIWARISNSSIMERSGGQRLNICKFLLISSHVLKAQEHIFSPNKGVQSLSMEEHGVFFDAMQRMSLSTEAKEAAVALYLDFKSRPVGEYNADRKNLDIFLLAAISLAAKAVGELRTDREFESKMFVGKDKLVDAEERLLRSFGVQDDVMPLAAFVGQLARRQIESMAEGFAERELIGIKEKEKLVQRSIAYLDQATDKGLSPKMSYRGRAAGAMLKATRDLDLSVTEADIARAAGFTKRLIETNTDKMDSLLRES